MPHFLAALGLIAMSFALTPSHAQDSYSATQADIEQIIQNYWMENPEALADALSNMQQHFARSAESRVQQTIVQNQDFLFRKATDFSMGPPDAPITIVEFFDYNCGYCKRVFPTLMGVVNASDDVRLVFKELPILGDNSTLAARTALALEDQLTFLTFHAKLMNQKSRLSAALISQTLADMKLDENDIAKRRQGAAIGETIEQNLALSDALQIEGTPAFIIGDQLYAGALDKQEFEDILNALRQKMAAQK
jgi:protein-disulfide isomerase